MSVTLAEIYPEHPKLPPPSSIGRGSVVMLGNDDGQPHVLAVMPNGQAVFVNLVSGRGWVPPLLLADENRLTRAEVVALVGHCPALGTVRYIGEARGVVHVDVPED